MLLQDLPLLFISGWKSAEGLLDWKLANIIPIFKKGKKEYPGNYSLAVSLQFLVKLWRRSFWELLKNASEAMSSSVKVSMVSWRASYALLAKYTFVTRLCAE